MMAGRKCITFTSLLQNPGPWSRHWRICWVAYVLFWNFLFFLMLWSGFKKALALDSPSTILLTTPLGTWWYPDTTKCQGSLELEKQAPWTFWIQNIFRLSAKFVRFSTQFGSLYVKIRNYMGNITCITCKWSNYVNPKSWQCKYHAIPLKRKPFLVKFLIYAVLLRFQICHDLRAFPLFSTWSSCIPPSPSLPLKPFVIHWLWSRLS